MRFVMGVTNDTSAPLPSQAPDYGPWPHFAKAKFAGTCGWCKTPVVPNQWIVVAKGGTAIHYDCPNAASFPIPPDVRTKANRKPPKGQGRSGQVRTRMMTPEEREFYGPARGHAVLDGLAVRRRRPLPAEPPTKRRSERQSPSAYQSR